MFVNVVRTLDDTVTSGITQSQPLVSVVIQLTKVVLKPSVAASTSAGSSAYDVPFTYAWGLISNQARNCSDPAAQLSGFPASAEPPSFDNFRAELGPEIVVATTSPQPAVKIGPASKISTTSGRNFCANGNWATSQNSRANGPFHGNVSHAPADHTEPSFLGIYTIITVSKFSSPLSSQKSPSNGEVVQFPIPESDVGLVAALLAGRAYAATTLFERHGRYIQRVLGRILGPDPELLDVLHDVFVEAMQSIHRLGDPKCLRAWLTTIAVHTARGHIRRRRRRRILQYLPFYAVPQVSVIPRNDEWSQPLRATYRVLDRMSDEDRILITLRYIEQLELTEVAAAVGLSLATVKRRLAKASQQFFGLAGTEPSLLEWMKEAQP